MKKIKILIIAGSMNVGGIENQLMHLLRKCDKEKFQIDFTTTVKAPFYREEIESLGAKCIYIPNTEGIHFFRYCKALYKVIKNGKYDIVHSHELFHSGMVLLVARMANVKSRFVHAHNWCDGNKLGERQSLKRRTYNWIMQKMIRGFGTDFLACSSYAGEFLYGKDITQKEYYHLIYNSVDTAKYVDKYDVKEDGDFCDDGWINILQVGRFSEVKNQLFSVEIAEILKKHNKKIRILCAGDCSNHYGQKVSDEIIRRNLQEHMMLIGIRKDIDALLRKSSAFLLPSMYEGMPLVLIEAQASGIPCVVADTFSHEVDFNIGTVDWLPISEDAEFWADAIEKSVIRNRANKEDVVSAINRCGFDSDIFAKKLCKLYEDAVNRLSR